MTRLRRTSFLNVIHCVAAPAAAIFLLEAGSCGGGGDGVTNPTATAVSVQIFATSSNPKVGETTIISPIAVNSGGVAVAGYTCNAAAAPGGILQLSADNGNWRGVGISAGVAVVTATCSKQGAANVVNTITITVRPGLVTLTVNKVGAGNGSVFINPPGGTYDTGTDVVITATALAGSTFTGWGGACAGVSATCSLTLNSNQTVTASFVLGPPTRVVAANGNLAFGSVTVGQTSSLVFSITNSGNAPLTVTGMTAPAGGAYTASWTNGTIAAGATQQVTVNFTPPAAQSYSGTLTVVGDQTSGTNTLPISGTGVGGSSGGSARYDGTYDFTFRNPGPGGVTETHTSSRYITIRNGAITSSDGAITSGSVDASGGVRFTSGCPINSSTATWTGSMNTAAPAGSNTGSGGYTCSIAIGGSNNTWSMTQH